MKRFLVLALALSLLAFAPAYAFAVANGTRSQTESGLGTQTQSGTMTQDQTQDQLQDQTQDQLQDQTRTQARTQTQDCTADCDQEPAGDQSMYQRSFKYAYAAGETDAAGQYREQVQSSNTGEDSQVKTENASLNGDLESDDDLGDGEDEDSFQTKLKRFFGDLMDTLTSLWRG